MTYSRPRSTFLLVMLLLVCFAASGCVRRRMTIVSNPPGAKVFVDGYEIGTTPVSTSFVYYGTREVKLIKDGYETLTTLHTVSRPWYQIPGIDFFSEVVYPREIRDERVLKFALAPKQLVPLEQTRGRAQQLRDDARADRAGILSSGVFGPPAAAPPPSVTAPQNIPPVETIPPGTVERLPRP